MSAEDRTIADAAERDSAAETDWFTEAQLPLARPGIELRIAVTDRLHESRSEFARIEVFDTPFYGRLLAIDGIVQTTTSDEFVYHEMMIALPMATHGDVRRVLIVGGGDGGALRQVVRSPRVERAVQVEIDDTVTRVSREFLPEVSQGSFDDPRVEAVYRDGGAFVRETDETFDLIVLDLTDPVPGGPAESLFGEDFLQAVRDRLAPGGIVMMQCGSLLLQPDEVAQQVARFRSLFDGNARLHHAVVPGYQLTSFGFLMGSTAPLATPDEETVRARLAELRGDMQYLSPAMHAASAVLPPYLEQRLGLA